MFSKIKSWFLGEISSIEGHLKALEALVASETRKSLHLDAVIATAQAAKDVALTEARKAAAAIEAIGKITSPVVDATATAINHIEDIKTAVDAAAPAAVPAGPAVAQ